MTTARSTSHARTASVEAHDAAVRQDFPGIVSYLREHLGIAAMSIIAGGVDPKTIQRWAKGTAPKDAEVERRIRSAYQIFQEIQQAEAPPTIRAWFLGMNPQLADLAPVEALAEGREREVLSAARAFTSGG